MMRKLMSRLEQTSKRVIASFAVFLVIFIGVVDFATGLELHLMFFYLLPIALVSWFVNRRTGMLIAALCTIAHAIRESVARPELVGRIGGTSFAILLPNAGSEEARFVLAKIQSKLKEQRKRYAQPVTFFISAIACTKAPRNIAELMHEAELRMIRMKNGSRDALEIALVDSSPALN